MHKNAACNLRLNHACMNTPGTMAIKLHLQLLKEVRSGINIGCHGYNCLNFYFQLVYAGSCGSIIEHDCIYRRAAYNVAAICMVAIARTGLHDNWPVLCPCSRDKRDSWAPCFFSCLWSIRPKCGIVGYSSNNPVLELHNLIMVVCVEEDIWSHYWPACLRSGTPCNCHGISTMLPHTG